MSQPITHQRPAAKFLTVPEIAAYLGISRQTVYRLISEYEALPATRVGRSIRVRQADFNRYLQNNQIGDEQ